MSLDTSTLYFIATMIAAMLGVMLLVFGRNEKIPALKWWGSAYLLGAASVALWTLASHALGGVLSLALTAVGFVACGMAEAIIDRLEMVDVEDQRRHRAAGLGLALDQP